MPQIFYFMLKVILCSGILFGYYHLFLRNKVYHAYNRYFLLCAVIISLLVPTIRFDIYNSEEQTQIQPIQMLQAVNNSDAYIEEMITTGHTNNIEVSDVLMILYVATALVLLISFLKLIVRIYFLIRRSEKNVLNDIVLINSMAEGTPFSFFKYLFWNNEIDINTDTGRHIFSHELAHIREKHSLDKVFLNVILVFCWLNPFFWLIRRELNMIHEFIADKKAVGQYDTAVLASMIIQTAYPKHNFLITNHFFYSPIKRRLEMLAKYRSTRASYFTRILVLPIMFVLIAAFTFKAKKIITNVIADKEFIVVIDAGHGGQDGGAKAVDGTNEKDLNLALAKMVKELNTNDNIRIILTRESDIYQKPQEKAEIANNLKADLFISIHTATSHPKYVDVTSGMEVYVAKDSFQNSKASKTFASAVIGTFGKNYKLKIAPNPIQRHSGVWILQASKCPTVLIEAGYISNYHDRDYLKSKDGIKTFATNLLDAISNYFMQPSAAAKPEMSASIAKMLGLTSDQINITNGDGDTIPKFTKDMLGLKGDEVTIIDDAEIIIRNNDQDGLSQHSVIVIGDKVYDVKTLSNKVVIGKKAKVYGKNNKIIIDKYGKRAMDGAIIFESGVIKDLPTGQYDVVINRANQDMLIDASQRLNEKTIRLKQLNESRLQNGIGVKSGVDSLNQPLYLLDGKKILLPTLKALDPNLIKSIDVLKGATAEQQYGVEAKHGAILIATKQLEEVVAEGKKLENNKQNDPVKEVVVNGNKLSPTVKQPKPEITLSGISTSRIPLNKLKDIKNIQIDMPGYKVISGTMFFAGAGFPTVATTFLNGESLDHVATYLKRIQAGTSITLDNVVIEDANGKRIAIGKGFSFIPAEENQ